MSDDDARQQQEFERERMQSELAALKQLDEAGMHELAEFFAADLGLTKQYKQEVLHEVD